ncbi:MAG TPA: zf-HC2 domain-containing protein [Fimbriimonas sp.]
MMARLFGCGKFQRLVHERVDRELTGGETRFLSRHRLVCPACRAMESTSAMALDMLRAATLDPAPAPQFDERVIRHWRVRRVRDSIGYWTPALAGAGIACIAIFAALALIGRPTQLKQSDLPGSEAKVFYPGRIFPNLELHESNSFVR